MTQRRLTFIWSGADARGQQKSGSIMSESRLQALMSLHEQGIVATHIRQQHTSVLTPGKTRITSKDIMTYSRHA